MKSSPPAARCVPQPGIAERRLLSNEMAVELADVFAVLASETRLRLLHALARQPGLNVTELADTIGLSPQAVSNQLRRLTDRRIVAGQRNGNSVHYRIVDPCTVDLLDRGACLVCTAADTPPRRGRGGER